MKKIEWLGAEADGGRGGRSNPSLGSIRIIGIRTIVKECVVIEVVPSCPQNTRSWRRCKAQQTESRWRAPSVHRWRNPRLFVFVFFLSTDAIFFSIFQAAMMATKSAPAMKQIKDGDVPAEVLLSLHFADSVVTLPKLRNAFRIAFIVWQADLM
jgi:hypothetical protein